MEVLEPGAEEVEHTPQEITEMQDVVAEHIGEPGGTSTATSSAVLLPVKEIELRARMTWAMLQQHQSPRHHKEIQTL